MYYIWYITIYIVFKPPISGQVQITLSVDYNSKYCL